MQNRFFCERGGGNIMIHLHNIYTPEYIRAYLYIKEYKYVCIELVHACWENWQYASGTLHCRNELSIFWYFAKVNLVYKLFNTQCQFLSTFTCPPLLWSSTICAFDVKDTFKDNNTMYQRAEQQCAKSTNVISFLCIYLFGVWCA